MRGRFSFILLVIFGSFCVYCAQNVVGNGGNGNGGNGGGMVGSAGADTCCTPPDPPAGTVLFDKKFPMAKNPTFGCVSPTIDVSGYRTIVVHSQNPYQSTSQTDVEWTFGGAAGWVRQYAGFTDGAAVITLDGRLGKQLRIGYGTFLVDCTQVQDALTVVGYKQ